MELSMLPTELIHTISGHLELPDQLFLCRTNHRLYAICVKWIYRVLDLKSPVQLLRCCKTIIARPEAAVSVLEFKIDCFPRYTLKSFHTTLQSAAIRMENLRVIAIYSRRLFPSIADMVFPRLTGCNIPLLLDSASSYSFLRRNPTIESTIIIPALDQSIQNHLHHIQPVHMPKLRHFLGPEIAACAVVPGSPLSTLRILWLSKPPMGYSRGLGAVASSTAEPRELTNVILSWDPALLRAIAMHTPRIECLNIRGQYLSGLTTEKKDFLSAMDATLRSLTCLKDLVIFDDTPFDRVADELESEFDRVRRWGDICPSLMRVTITDGFTAWKRFYEIWVPWDCFATDLESVECLKWFITKTVVSPELPSFYRILADNFAGVAGMRVLEEAVERGEAVPAFDILPTEGGGTVISFPSNP
ncbi:hypothetical protein MSAN_00211600 [Mycena sanguinolenta]|uniref:F-box domain-containing protein n=1 Tax=Mycena sanguinolenta TaxID=230812 RepID=A0A8H6ZF71_9AGAR|nr:hypothetical protein MSAN_00211600 [Mycena sanguinolenta]